MNRIASLAVASFVSYLAVGAAYSADYPSKPIRIIVSTGAGGGPDLTGRVLAEALSTRYRQPVIVELKPGGDELVALNAIAIAPPDGYTLGFISSSILALLALNKSFHFELNTDFAPITPTARADTVVVVSSISPYRTIDELIAGMKANPGKLNMGGTAAFTRFQDSMFRAVTGTKFETVRYSSSPQAVQAVLAGDIDGRMGVSISSVKSLGEAGKLRILAVNAAMRSYFLPNVPALSESKVPEVQELTKSNLYSGLWYALIAPTNTSSDLANSIYSDVREIVKDAGYIKRLRDLSHDAPVAPPSPAEFRALIVRESTAAVKIAQQAGIKPQ